MNVDHNAERVFKFTSHHNLAYKFIPVSQAKEDSGSQNRN